jgi:hypothetical protein
VAYILSFRQNWVHAALRSCVPYRARYCFGCADACTSVCAHDCRGTVAGRGCEHRIATASAIVDAAAVTGFRNDALSHILCEFST